MNAFLLAVSAFDFAVDKLRTELMYVACALVIIGVWESSWKAGNDPKAILGILLKMIIIVSLIAFFPSILNKGKELFEGLRNIVNSVAENRFKSLLIAEVPEVNILSISAYLASLIIIALQKLGQLGILIVEYFQTYSLGCLTALSPLMIGLLAISYTQNIGIKFLMTSLNVVMWSFGFILVDLFLNYLGNGVLAEMLSVKAGPAGAIVAGAIVFEIASLPTAVGVMLIAALVPTFFYLATPMAVASLMSGANAGAAAAWGGLSNIGQTAQQATRGSEMLRAMQMQSAVNPASQNAESTNKSIPRPPNPIV